MPSLDLMGRYPLGASCTIDSNTKSPEIIKTKDVRQTPENEDDSRALKVGRSLTRNPINVSSDPNPAKAVKIL